MTAPSLEGMIQKVGGDRNATIIVAVGGAGVVWLIGRRKNAKSQQAQPVSVMAQGYADTAQDPTAVYTGYDQLQQEIDALRQQPGAPNSNPVPVPTSPGSPPPVAPIPAPPATPAPAVLPGFQQPDSSAGATATVPQSAIGPVGIPVPLTTGYGRDNWGPGPGGTSSSGGPGQPDRYWG